MDRVTLQLWTSLRRSEEQLASSNKQLALARDDLDAFSYSMAHQLRGPIRQIAGFANILAKEYGSHLPQEAYRHLERVRRGAEQIGETSDHLLHWARRHVFLYVASASERAMSVRRDALRLVSLEQPGRNALIGDTRLLIAHSGDRAGVRTYTLSKQ